MIAQHGLSRLIIGLVLVAYFTKVLDDQVIEINSFTLTAADGRVSSMPVAQLCVSRQCSGWRTTPRIGDRRSEEHEMVQRPSAGVPQQGVSLT